MLAKSRLTRRPHRSRSERGHAPQTQHPLDQRIEKSRATPLSGLEYLLLTSRNTVQDPRPVFENRAQGTANRLLGHSVGVMSGGQGSRFPRISSANYRSDPRISTCLTIVRGALPRPSPTRVLAATRCAVDGPRRTRRPRRQRADGDRLNAFAASGMSYLRCRRDRTRPAPPGPARRARRDSGCGWCGGNGSGAERTPVAPRGVRRAGPSLRSAAWLGDRSRGGLGDRAAAGGSTP